MGVTEDLCQSSLGVAGGIWKPDFSEFRMNNGEKMEKQTLERFCCEGAEKCEDVGSGSVDFYSCGHCWEREKR